MAKGRRGRGGKRLWPEMSGPVLTLALVLLLEVEGSASTQIPDFGAFLVIAVMYSAFLGGLLPGLISAAIMVAYYTHFLVAPRQVVYYTSLERFAVAAIVSPAVALLSAYLKMRLDRIWVRDRAARAEAEAAERRSAFLSEASQALSASLNYDLTLASLAKMMVPSLSDMCAVHVAEDEGQIRQVAVAHVDPVKERLVRELADRVRADAGNRQSQVARVIRTGRPEIASEVSSEMLETLSEDPEVHRLWVELSPGSILVVPMVAHGRTLGALTLVTAESGRRYGPEDLAFAEEIAQRAALAVDNARLYEAALAASKAKSDFLAVMSHELKTPLTTVVACTDLLEAEISGPLTRDQRDQLGHILASALHLLQLIDEILSFSRMEAGREKVQLEWVELSELVREAAALIEPVAADKGLRFQVYTPDLPTSVEVDPPKVRQILLNLLSNAVKFTDEGGVALHVWKERRFVVFQVRDTGIGIDPEHLERIFESFWQVEQSATRRAGGTGLGLSVARRLARLLGGDVTVESQLAQGTTFTVRLPARRRAPSTAADAAVPAESP